MSLSQERKSSQLPHVDRVTLFLRDRFHHAPSELPKQTAPEPKPEVIQSAKVVASVEEAKRKANVSPDSLQKVFQNIEPSISHVAKAKPAATFSPTVSTATINYATQPEPTAVIQQNVGSATIKNKSKFDAGIEELIRDFHWNSQPVSENPLNNVKNESRMECPTSVHQQKQQLPAPHRPPLMPATVKHFGGSQAAYQSSNGNQLFSQNWQSIGGQVHGAKQMGSTQYLHASTLPAYVLNPSMFSAMPAAPMNKTPTGAIKPLSSFPVVPVVPMQSGYHNDFSALMHETLSRR